MARDYEAELLEIEKNRQANNEKTREEGRTERNQLESAIKEYPEHEALYREEISASQKREDAFVAANDKTAGAKAGEIEADRRAELEAATSASEVKLVEPPPPVNDNSSDKNSILAAKPPQEEQNSQSPGEAEKTGIFRAMHESGFVDAVKTTMTAVGIVGALDGVAHPFGKDAAELMKQVSQQPPAVERVVTSEEIRDAVQQMGPVPQSGEYVHEAPKTAPVTAEQLLGAVDKGLNEKASEFVPQESEPAERVEAARESGEKAAAALKYADENARSRSGEDLLPPKPDPAAPANDNQVVLTPPPPPPPPPEQSATYQSTATFGP